MPLKRVVYFSRVDIGRSDNGGGLVCRNHARRIAETDGVELTVCNAGPSLDLANAAVFANSIGAAFEPIAFLDSVKPKKKKKLKWPMQFEIEARAQHHVDRELDLILNRVKADILVVDYLYSALFIPSAYRRKDIRRITITLNREVEFARKLRRLNLSPSTSWKSELKLFCFEQAIFSKSHAVVALCPRDLPFPRPAMRRKVIYPVFDCSDKSWAGDNSDNLFFVGNVGHYPNKIAVEWLVRKLSPALQAIGSPAKIDIVGVTDELFDHLNGRPNVRLHGIGTHDDAVRNFLTCGLFIAPIENPFGSKIKLLDSLSFATPFAATSAALSGVPFLKDVPLVDLDKPMETAQSLTQLLSDANGRRALSSSIKASLTQQLIVQKAGWNELLHC